MRAEVTNVYGDDLLKKYRQALKNKGFRVDETVSDNEFEHTIDEDFPTYFKLEFNGLDDLEKIRAICEACALKNDDVFGASLLIDSPYPNGDWDITIYDSYLD